MTGFWWSRVTFLGELSFKRCHTSFKCVCNRWLEESAVVVEDCKQWHIISCVVPKVTCGWRQTQNHYQHQNKQQLSLLHTHTHTQTCECDRSLGSLHSDPVQAQTVRYYRHVLYHILQDALGELWGCGPWDLQRLALTYYTQIHLRRSLSYRA